MARKHSSKTATQEAIKNSEPRIITYRGWQGVNFADAPLTWDPLETGPNDHRQSDLQNNYLMVQNNLITTSTNGLETRPDSIVLGTPPSIQVYMGQSGGASSYSTLATTFTGVATVYRKWLFCAARISGVSPVKDVVVYKPLDSLSTAWSVLRTYSGADHHNEADYHVARSDTSAFSIEEIGMFQGYLLISGAGPSQSELLVAKIEVGANDSSIAIKGLDSPTKGYTVTGYVCGVQQMPDPVYNDFYLQAVNMTSSTEVASDTPVRLQVCRCYTTPFGSTLPGAVSNTEFWKTIYVDTSPALWTKQKYLQVISGVPGSTPTRMDRNICSLLPINGIDFYARENDNTDWVFIGHVNIPGTIPQVPDSMNIWTYDWYGAMADISQWKNSQLVMPEENTSSAVHAKHFSSHDSRLYFWGTEGKPYRLWIGGGPNNELSVARGLGGAWVDIEAGSGYDISGLAKWKTAGGSNIITILCGNKNTTKVKRFNLVETNMTYTNENSTKSYMYEEVSNVTGCNSRWGYGVFAKGLYSINRYGLMVCTMASEYNSQMENQKLSDVIDPIFSERIGKRLNDARMVYIDGMIYIALSEESGHPSTPTSLDNVILCYNVETKAWYTYTCDDTYGTTLGGDPDRILNLISVDSDEAVEGLGVITASKVSLYPTTGIQDPTVPPFQVIMETGELIPRMPKQAFWYIQQLEFRFDYFIGNPNDPATILIEGTDYYGRRFKIEKNLNIQSRGHHGLTGEQRSYIEWVRVDKLVESLRIRIKGKARFKLTHINSRSYQQPDTIGTPYGFDARDTYKNRQGNDHEIHHYIKDYNNLREAVIA